MIETIESFFSSAVLFSILILEIISTAVILYFSGKSVWFLLCRRHQDSRQAMTEGITTGLNLLVGSEVLKTIVAPDWSDIGMICAILLMRAGIGLLVKWESRNE